jgi:putative membrane protein
LSAEFAPCKQWGAVSSLVYLETRGLRPEMSPKLKKFIQSWIINTLAVAVAAFIVPGIQYQKPLNLIIASLLLGILNAFIRPVLLLMALPLLIFTLGLFILVINAVLLWFVGQINPEHFMVKDFWSAFWGALIISIVSVVLNSLTGTGKTRIEFRRGRRPPPGSGSSGGGPVIDV